MHVRIRAGSDIAFLGALINYVLTNDRYFREYVCDYTNAIAIVSDDFRDTEDLDGLFSGFDAESCTVRPELVAVQGLRGGRGGRPPRAHRRAGAWRARRRTSRTAIRRSWTTRWRTRAASSRSSSGTSPATRRRWSRRSAASRASASSRWPRRCATTRVASGPRPSCTRSAGRSTPSACSTSAPPSILQLLLGNIGRPGGGILALRGHASIQGSTDIPTLYNILPGYLPMPIGRARRRRSTTYIEPTSPPTGYWGHAARVHDVAAEGVVGRPRRTEDNDYCFDYLPRIDGDHSAYATLLRMADGEVEGYFVMGENPVVGAANGRCGARRWRKLDGWWCATSSRSRRRRSGATSPSCDRPRSSSCPPPPTPRRTGPSPTPSACCSGTTRRSSRRATAGRSCGSCTTWGGACASACADSDDPKDRPLLDLTWDYPTEGAD